LQAVATVAVGGAVSGAISSGTWEGAYYGAFSSLAFYGVGQEISSAAWARGSGASGLSAAGLAAKTVSHGLIGGAVAHAQGGKFGHGFLSSGVTAASSPYIANGFDGNPFAQGALASMVGGTVSSATGGKFANGAVTAAMGFAFNQGATSQDEIRIGLSEQNPDGGFSSSEEAILAQHRANEGAFQATASDEELVGFIGVRTIDDVDRFFFSDMIKVDATFDFSFIPVGPRDLRIFMISHTHPAATGTSQEGFSRRDSRLVGSKRNPGFRMNVRTPSGDVRILTPDTSRGVRM